MSLSRPSGAPGPVLSISKGTADDVNVSGYPAYPHAVVELSPGILTFSTVAANNLGDAIETSGTSLVNDDSISSQTLQTGGVLFAERDTIDVGSPTAGSGIVCSATCSVEDDVIKLSYSGSNGISAICGAAPCANVDATISNSTIAGSGTAIFAQNVGDPGTTVHASVDSSLLHATDAIVTSGGQPAVVDTSYDAFDPSTDHGTGTVNDHGGNINPSNPWFADPWKTYGGDCVWQLVDAGNPAPLGLLDSTTDVKGNPRVFNGRRDIGAYECNSLAPTASITQDLHSALVGQKVHFDGSGSKDPNAGGTLKYLWTFDKGTQEAINSAAATVTTAFYSPGLHTVKLTVTEPSGQTATATATVQVSYGTPPSLTHLRQSARRWRLGTKLATLARTRRPPVGTTFTFTLSSAAYVGVVFTHQGRHGKRISDGYLKNVLCHAGRNKLRFYGRMSRGHRLRPGSYRATFSAVNTHFALSKPQSLRFTVVK